MTSADTKEDPYDAYDHFKHKPVMGRWRDPHVHNCHRVTTSRLEAESRQAQTDANTFYNVL